METKEPPKMNIKHMPKLFKKAAIAWNNDDPWRMSAIVAYYAILSLPGLLVIIMQMLGYFWGVEIVESKVYSQIQENMGQAAADSIESIFQKASEGDSSTIATIIGIGALIFGATGVFYHLQISMNAIWKVKSVPKRGFIRYLIDCSRSFGFVLIIAFLLLISFVLSSFLTSMHGFLTNWLHDFSVYLLHFAEIVISLGVITLLFALIFKYLPDVIIGWKSVWIGAFITSLLFTLGKAILSFYFSEANPGNVYGAAGSIIIILL